MLPYLYLWDFIQYLQEVSIPYLWPVKYKMPHTVSSQPTTVISSENDLFFTRTSAYFHVALALQEALINFQSKYRKVYLKSKQLLLYNQEKPLTLHVRIFKIIGQIIDFILKRLRHIRHVFHISSNVPVIVLEKVLFASVIRIDI